MMTDLLGLMNADEANRPHWEGARMGQIRVQQCAACGRRRFPAAAVCSECGDKVSTWVEIGSTGRILAWCRFHRAYFKEFAHRLPYIVLLVELEYGIRLYANLAVKDLDVQPVIGSTVNAVFDSVDDRFGLVNFRFPPGDL